MKLVIFGAGASYDCLHQLNNPTYYQEINKSYRPPLGKDLFGMRESYREIMQKYPGVEALKSELFLYDDIEEYFQEKWDFVENNRATELMAQIINIQYYLQELFHIVSENFCKEGLSNYEVMVRKAYEYTRATGEEICFTSFNYDTLLEKAFQSILGCNFDNMQDYLSNSVKLIKPHGSCNWYSKFNQSFFEQINEHIDIANHLYKKQLTIRQIEKELQNDYTILTDPIWRNEWQPHSQTLIGGYFPRVLIPLKSKDEFVLPNSHLNCLTDHLGKVTEILIIGWKGSEQHFQNLLKQTIGGRKVEIILVTCEDETPKENLSSYLPNAEFYMFNKNGGSFSSYVRSIHTKSYENFFQVKKS